MNTITKETKTRIETANAVAIYDKFNGWFIVQNKTVVADNLTKDAARAYLLNLS